MVMRIDKPNEKQEMFLRATTRFVGYGGSRGGGKSWALRVKAGLMAVKYPGIKILILRRTYADLDENHILPMMEWLHAIVRYKDDKKLILFPNGSRIKFGYCDNERDLLQYQGREYDVICIDEATQFEEAWFEKLKACMRGTNNFPKRMYLTCNPGGVGHTWVKRLFIDKSYKDAENPDDYTMIRAKVYDNKALTEKDPGYIKMLETLPDGLREAWLEGDWDIFEGQYFREFNRDIHVIQPFAIQAHWRRYVVMDYGLDMLACYWIAVDEHENAVVYRELYESGLIVSDAASKINAMTVERVYAYYAPPDLWNRHSDTGKSTAEIFAEYGILLVKASNDRVQGWMNLHEWLKPYTDEQGQMTAHLRIFEGCSNLIRTLPALQYDQRNQNDCAKDPHEVTHAPDALRCWAAGRPLPATIPKKEPDRMDEMEQMEEIIEFGR